MDMYSGFAKVYDTFMDETPYEEWRALIVSLLERYGADDGELTGEAGIGLKQERNTILDLGCGTGTLTELLAKEGYDMIGVDNSVEMLEIAMEKKEKSKADILYLLQDMREFELYGTTGAVVSVCDSLNYLLNEEDILTVLRLVNNYLYPKGLFIFDFNTVYKYETVIGDATIAENREDCSFIWENYYHPDEEINEYDLTLFVKNNDSKEEDNLFYRFEETHYQRGYRLEQMKRLLNEAGLLFIDAFDADTKKAPTPQSERIFVVAREQGK